MKKNCISYPTESLIFCKLLLLFQNKARIADSYFNVISLFVYDNSYIASFYAMITKIGTYSYHCRFTQSKPDKESYVAV